MRKKKYWIQAKRRKKKKRTGREGKEGRRLIRNYSNQKTMERYLYICRN